MSRIVTKQFNVHIPKATQGYILCNFSRSFLVEKCQDSTGTERELLIQLTNQGEAIEDFTPFHAGLGVFIANGYNIIWYRNPSIFDIDFVCLVSQDVLQSSNIYGNVKVENPRDYTLNPNGDIIPLSVDINGNTSSNPIFVSVVNQAPDEDKQVEEIVLHNGEVGAVQNISEARIRLEVSPFSIDISTGQWVYNVEKLFTASIVCNKTVYVKDYRILHNNGNNFHVCNESQIAPFINDFQVQNTLIKAGNVITFKGNNVGGFYYPTFWSE